MSQFTLQSTLKGTKPDFHYAMSSDQSKEFYEKFLANLKKEGYLAVVPMIKPLKTTFVNKPVNTSYANIKVSQDFDPDSVFTNFKSGK